MGNITSSDTVNSTVEPLEERILKTLHKLENEEFEIFKLRLRDPDVLEGLHPISKSLQDRILMRPGKRTITRQMVRRYSCKEAQQIMVKVLKNINRNDLVGTFPDIPDKDSTIVATSDQHEATVAETPMSRFKIQASVRNTFIDQHRRVLIEKVTNVKSILDVLLEERAIRQEGYDNVRSKATNQDMMRELYANLNNRKAKRIFFNSLLEYEQSLLDDLGCPQPSPPAATPVSDLRSGHGIKGGQLLLCGIRPRKET